MLPIKARQIVPKGPLNINFKLPNKMKRSDNIESGLNENRSKEVGISWNGSDL